MGDEGNATAPSVPRSDSAIVEAGARRLAPLRTADPATTNGSGVASPQPADLTTAQAGELPETEQPENEAQATLPADDGSDTSDEQQPPEQVADSITIEMDDGTTKTLTREQVRDGVMLKEDHTRKSQLMAQARDQVLQTMQELVAYRETAAKLIYQHLPEIDHSLRATDPGLWAAQMEERREKMGQVAQLMGQAQVTREQLEAESQAYAQREIPRALGHWHDKATELREQELARKYVAAEGIPEATIERIKADPWLIRLAVWAAKHDQSLKGAAKGGKSTQQRLQAPQPSPSIAMAQTRPAPAGTARSRQLNGQARSGEAVPTRPGHGLRGRFDLGASRLAPLPAPSRG